MAYRSMTSDQVMEFVSSLNAAPADQADQVIPPSGVLRESVKDVGQAIDKICASIEASVPKKPRGMDADRLEGKWALQLYHAFVPLGPRVLNDLGFWRFVACEKLPRFVMWRDSSEKNGASKEGFGGGRSASGFQDCVPYRMFRRGQIAALAQVKKMSPEQIANIEGTDLWRSHVLRIRLGNAPTAAAAFLQVANNRRGGEVSLTDLVREAAKLVQRLSTNVVFVYLDEAEATALITPEFDAALPLAVAAKKARDQNKKTKAAAVKPRVKSQKAMPPKNSRRRKASK